MPTYTERVKEELQFFESQQALGKAAQSGSKSLRTIEREAQTFPIRDEQGTLLLFEDKNAPGLNVNRQDQFISVDIQSEVFDIEEVKKALDIEIRELKREKTIEEKLQDFFRLYENLLPQVPLSGETGSLQFLIRRGSEQQSGELFDPFTFEEITSGSFGDLIQRLLTFQSSLQGLTNTSASLVSLTDSLRRQLEAMGELVLLSNVSGSQGVSLSDLLSIIADIVGGEVESEEDFSLPVSGIGVNTIRVVVDTVRTDVVKLTRINVPQTIVDYSISFKADSPGAIGLTIERASQQTPFEIRLPTFSENEVPTGQFTLTLTLQNRDGFTFDGWYKNNEEFSNGFITQITNDDGRPGTTITMSIGFDISGDGSNVFEPAW